MTQKFVSSPKLDAPVMTLDSRDAHRDMSAQCSYQWEFGRFRTRLTDRSSRSVSYCYDVGDPIQFGCNGQPFILYDKSTRAIFLCENFYFFFHRS